MLAAGPYWMHIPQRMGSIFIRKKGMYNPLIVAVTQDPRFKILGDMLGCIAFCLWCQPETLFFLSVSSVV